MSPHTRRRFLAAATAAGVSLAGCLDAEAPSGELERIGGNWPMIGRDGEHTRRVESGPTRPGTAWSAELDDARAAGPAALLDETLYVPVDAVAEGARYRYRLHALAAATGERRWQVSLRSEPNGPPAVRGDYVVLTARPSLGRGRIVGFETRYGGEQWLFDVDARLTAPPTVHGAAVYVPDWAGRVHALSIYDGTVRWSRSLGSEESGRTFAQPVAVEDRRLYLGSASGATGVVALDADTGEPRWSRSTGAVTGGPLVDGDLVVVRSHHLLVGLGTDGTRRWTVNLGDARGGPMAIDERGVYVPTGGGLRAIGRDGTGIWTYEPSDGQVGAPTAAGDEVVVRTGAGLAALSRADGSEQWSVTAESTGRPVVVPGGIFTAGSEGQVAAFGER